MTKLAKQVWGKTKTITISYLVSFDTLHIHLALICCTLNGCVKGKSCTHTAGQP